MIKSFAHKGLEKFFLTGNTAGIQTTHARKLRLILDLLNAAANPGDVNFPGSMLHPLKGNKGDYWSVRVSGNWRITFRFENSNAYIVNYEDYH